MRKNRMGNEEFGRGLVELGSRLAAVARAGDREDDAERAQSGKDILKPIGTAFSVGALLRTMAVGGGLFGLGDALLREQSAQDRRGYLSALQNDEIECPPLGRLEIGEICGDS